MGFDKYFAKKLESSRRSQKANLAQLGDVWPRQQGREDSKGGIEDNTSRSGSRRSQHVADHQRPPTEQRERTIVTDRSRNTQSANYLYWTLFDPLCDPRGIYIRASKPSERKEIDHLELAVAFSSSSNQDLIKDALEEDHAKQTASNLESLFAYTPGQLSKSINPKSCLYAIDSLRGLEKERLTDENKNKGLSSNGAELEPVTVTRTVYQSVKPREAPSEEVGMTQMSDDSPQNGADCIAWETGFMGRQHLSRWKEQEGRSKDWRRSSFAHVLSSRQLAAQPQATEMRSSKISKAVQFTCNGLPSGRNWHLTNIPAVDLKLSKHRLCRPYGIVKIFNGGIDRPGRKSKGRRCLEDALDFDLQIRDRKSQPSKLRRQKNKTPVVPVSPDEVDDELQTSKSHSIEDQSTPPGIAFHYSGEVINTPYGLLRILQHIRTEAHGEVYSLENLDSGLEYETKVYSLRKLDKNTRARRAENLRKVKALDSTLYWFDHEEKHYCATPTSPHMEQSKAAGKKMSRLGAIGRRNTPEYRDAFPELPSSIPLIEAIEDSVVLNDLLTLAKQAGSHLPLGLRFMARLMEIQPAWAKEAKLLLRDAQYCKHKKGQHKEKAKKVS